jgi:hypothetical protein
MKKTKSIMCDTHKNFKICYGQEVTWTEFGNEYIWDLGLLLRMFKHKIRHGMYDRYIHVYKFNYGGNFIDLWKDYIEEKPTRLYGEPVNDYKQPVKRNKKVIGTFNNKIDIDRMMTRSQKKKKDEEDKEEQEIHNKTINDILQYDNAKEYIYFPSPFKTYVKKN